jgi:HTH-type transcriptional regulator / antitoxin HipB
MFLHPDNLRQLGKLIKAERKRQKLTREQAAAVCCVSPSFIRDAEANPGACSFEKLMMLCHRLGMSLVALGYEASQKIDDIPDAKRFAETLEKSWSTDPMRLRMRLMSPVLRGFVP